MIEALDYGFYTVNLDYLKYLNSIDSEVYYNSSYQNTIKPFVGIIVGIEDYHYFIPLSSAKEKHKKWKNVSDDHFLIYEVINNSLIKDDGIYKDYSDEKKIHILSILDIKKMISIPLGCYEKVVFEELNDEDYQNLFQKEYHFCLTIKEKVLKKVEKIYQKQKETGIVRKTNCNFLKLEEAMLKWEEMLEASLKNTDNEEI